MDKIPIFICGGHFSPALAIIEELSKYKKIKIYYIGRRDSIEYREIKNQKLDFLEISAGKFNRFMSMETFSYFLKVPQGFIQSLKYLKKFKPKLVLSFGGFISLPICIVARIFGIPVITHEQTRVMGLSNQIISIFADYICLTYSDTKKVPSFIKTITVGIPLRKSILQPESSGITNYGNRRLPLIYITGGSQGASSVNTIIYNTAPNLLKKYRLFHICGGNNNFKDYHKLSKLRLKLDKNSAENYYLTPFIKSEKVGEILADSNLIVSRSGANTVAEIAHFQKKAILIPLPWSANNEQMENALFLKEMGLAVIINQKKADEKILTDAIDDFFIKKNNIIQKPDKFNWLTNGTKRLSDLILYVLKYKKIS